MASVYDGTTYHSDDSDLIDPQERQGYVSNVLTQATRFIEEELSPDRAEATDYYMGRLFGNEEEGRSRVVSTDVRDAVQSIMPSLLRVFFGPERAVEFRPRKPEDVEGAEQATEFISEIVLKVDNNGFVELYSAFKDALVRRMGIVKWWYDEQETEEELSYTGLTDEAVQVLMQEPGVEIEEAERSEDGLWNVTIERTTKDGKVRFAAIPPEEFIYNSTARSLEDALMVGHRREMSMGELMEMGYDEETLREAITFRAPDNQEEEARSLHSNLMGADEAEEGLHRPILYTEAYFILQNEEKKLELRRICTIGEGYKIVMDESAPEKPFALFVPDPEPHTIEGLSIADRTMDIQKIKSAVLRANLDSLALTLTPATEVVEGQVNMQDVLNTEIGKVIRAKAPGMMREIDHRYVGADSFPMLTYLDDMKENRIGVSKASAGLNADALQSSTKAAVNATVEAARMQLEMIARIFAETGMRDLMRGLLRMTIRHQQPGRIVRLRNQFVPIDPRVWNADMDVTVNVALGSALLEDKIMTLTQIAQKQEQILQMLGSQNPLVTASQYRYTLAKMVELLGFKDPSKFFKEIDEEQLKQAEAEAAQQQAQQPDPAMQLAQAEIAKSQNDIQVSQAKLQLDAQKAQQDMAFEKEKLEMQGQMEVARLEQQERMAQAEHARQMERIAAETALKKIELELRYDAQIKDAEMRAETDLRRAAMQAETQRQTAETVAEIKKPRKRSVKVERDEAGRVVGQTISEEE